MNVSRAQLSARLSHVRANPLEFGLLLVAIVAIAVAMDKTVEVGLRGDRSRDLTFAGASAELGRTLSSNGAPRVGRMERAYIVVGGDTAVVDTIVVVADSTVEPAFATGGFLRDQIALYNDYAIRQALLSLGDSTRPTRTRSDGPTMLHAAWADDGTRTLSDQPNPYGLVIRSPYAEEAWRDVRTTDWRRSPGLLGYSGEISLPAEMKAGQFHARLNGRDCGVNREPPQFYMYCQTTLGATANRFYDFSFQVNPSVNGGRFATAGPYRQRRVWMNGRAETIGQRPVHGGDVFDVQALGPFVLSAADWGTLAAEQWINGRRTFSNPRLGTLSFFAAAGRSTSSPNAGSGPLTLSFDAALAGDLDRETRHFLTAHGRLLSRIAVVVLDVRTGEVKAIAEPGRASDDEPLLSFEPILVGSVVKPIVAAAILSRWPALGAVRVAYAGDTVTSVAGVSLKKGFANAANGCGSEIGFSDFLRCSSNQYAAELLVRSLQQDGWAARGASSLVPRATLERSAIATGLAEVFDVDAYANRTGGRLPLYWSADSTGIANASSVTTDRTLIPYESRPWILFPDSTGTRVDWLARYAFGGWENRWTLLGLAQAYARIATGRNVQATFLHRIEAADTGIFKAASPGAAAAFGRVRSALRDVARIGTAAGLAEHLRGTNQEPIVVLAKTGTLNEGAAGGRLKTLVVAMGRAVGHDETAALSCGLVAVTYFEFADDRRAQAQRAALPRIHRDFAEGPFADVIARHWSRVSGCNDSPRPQTVARPPLMAIR